MSMRSPIVVAAAVACLTGCSPDRGNSAGPGTTPSALLTQQPALLTAIESTAGALAPAVSWSCIVTLAPSGWFTEATTDPACGPRRGADSPLRPLGIGGQAATAPANLAASVSGSTVTLTWAAMGSEPAISYLVEAGSSPGLTDLASFDTGNGATSLVVTSVPGGTYYVRIRARAASGLSAPSNETIVMVADLCSGVPAAPSGLVISSTGSTVTLRWTSPSSGCAPTTYVIEAGSSSALSDLANLSTGSTATFFSASGVGDGRYYVRVRAGNASGVSGPSDETPIAVGALFADEFGQQFDLSKWDVFRGVPSVADGRLTLNGAGTRADLQTRSTFLFGVLTLVVESSAWTVSDPGLDNDGSFGVEHFLGSNGQCHHSIVLKADGTLGLLNPRHRTDDACFGDPLAPEQAHLPIPNWDALRARRRLIVTLIWSPTMVTLQVGDGMSLHSVVSTTNRAVIPDRPLKIRLNADTNQVYLVEYVAFSRQ